MTTPPGILEMIKAGYCHPSCIINKTLSREHTMNTRILIVRLILAAVICSCNAFAQSQPFVYTLASTALQSGTTVIHYDAAYGEKTFEPFGGDNFEQNAGIRATVSDNLLFIGNFGVASTNRSSRVMEHGELLYTIWNEQQSGFGCSAGAGMRREYGGTNVMLSRLVIGKQFASWHLDGNILLEKAFSADRDEIDLMTTIGCSYAVSSSLHAGIEAIGQDLEGFWDPNEAEGGAVVFFGPVLSFRVPETSLTMTVGGGPILRATNSPRFSGAVRDVAAVTGNGFVIRTMVSFGL